MEHEEYNSKMAFTEELKVIGFDGYSFINDTAIKRLINTAENHNVPPKDVERMITEIQSYRDILCLNYDFTGIDNRSMIKKISNIPETSVTTVIEGTELGNKSTTEQDFEGNNASKTYNSSSSIKKNISKITTTKSKVNKNTRPTQNDNSNMNIF
jgi:hypothetical protein